MAFSTLRTKCLLNLSKSYFTSTKHAKYTLKIVRTDNRLILQPSIRHMWASRGKKSEQLRKNDGVNADYELVYRSPVMRYCNYGQIIGVVTAIAYSVIFFVTSKDGNLNYDESKDRYVFGPESLTEFIIGSTVMAAFIISITYVAMKSPVRIYSDGRKYICILNGYLGPITQRKFEFVTGDCSPAPPSKFSMWNVLRYKVRHKEFYIFENHFSSNVYFNRMFSLKY